MKIGIRHCLAIIALIAVGLAFAMRASRATEGIDDEGDSAVGDMKRAEVAMPYAVPSFLAFGGAIALFRHGRRVASESYGE